MPPSVPQRDWSRNYGPASESVERRIFADACRRSSWRITKMIAADLGRSASTITRMTSGEDVSYFEQACRWMARAEREGLARRDALAPLLLAIRRFLTPEELEEIAANMREERAGATAAAEGGLEKLEFIRRELAEGRVRESEIPHLCGQLRRGVELYEEVKGMVREILNGQPVEDSIQ